jgi:hypothetical protein
MTLVVGRDRGCDVRLDDGSVSRRHAEVVRLSAGRIYVTDRASVNGTFVLDGGEWRAVRQTLLEPSGRVRFGDHEMSAGRLDALCLRIDARAASDERRAGGSADSIPEPVQKDAPRRFDPDTGEVVEPVPANDGGPPRFDPSTGDVLNRRGGVDGSG